MQEKFFSIIVPNYNNSLYIEKSLMSILNQNFTNYELIIIDDVSTDNSVEIINKIIKDKDNIKFFPLTKKAWNGGSRNIGLQAATGKYIIFLDSDDWLYDRHVLKQLYNFIINHNEPDLLRIPFQILTPEGREVPVPLYEEDLKTIANSCFVGAPTKCIKREKIIPFPENTLMEDAVHHIAQIDVIDTFENFDKMLFIYNKQNIHSTSTDQKQQNSKWESSLYRMYADLLDMKCKHDYCEERRQWKLNQIKNNIKNDNYIQ